MTVDMVLVPVEPTPAMLEAFNRVAEWLKTNDGTRYAVAAAMDGATGEPYWRAMVEAAGPVSSDDLLPLPAHFSNQHENVQKIVRAYARANVAHATAAKDAEIAQYEVANKQLHAHGERMHAEIERLRQDVGTATRMHAITREHLEAAEARAERLLAEREVIAAEAVKYADKSGRLEAEIEALRAELDRLRGHDQESSNG